jgi:hypothetical protein
MVFLLSEYHAREIVPGYLGKGKLAQMIHPLNAADNNHFFVSVSNARKETFGVDRSAACERNRKTHPLETKDGAPGKN